MTKRIAESRDETDRELSRIIGQSMGMMGKIIRIQE